VVRLAALLHDVGHYAFSHAMEELEPETIPGHHEDMAGRFLGSESIRSILSAVDPDAPQMISELIRGVSDHPLQGLVSGSLDLDKIDYLRRDSLFCGVPYGAVDVERLLNSLTLAREGSGELEVGVTEKGVSALESLLFAKYQMFRNVYWHHAVRSATVTFRGLIETALEVGVLNGDELPGRTDEELLGLLAARVRDGDPPPILRTLLDSLVNRRLPKRVIEIFSEDLESPVAPWVSERRDPVRQAEARLAAEWAVERGSVFIDYPANPTMLELKLLLVRRTGEVQRLTSRGAPGLIDLPRLGRSLLQTTRVLRVFSLEPVGERDAAQVLEWITI
jgi:HD superfamily phosphohydrolase